MLNRALAFSVVSLMAVGCGGTELSDPESASMGESVAGMAQAASCSITTQGGPTSCKPYSLWKQYTVDYCQSIGAVASNTQVRESCGGDNYRYADMTCCPASPPPAPTCTTTTQGGPTSCKPYSLWKQYTVDYCQSIGATATNTGVRESCGGDNYRYADMTCCK